MLPLFLKGIAVHVYKKGILSHLVLFFVLTSSYAQNKYNAFDIVKDHLIVPPNGILIGDSLFLDDSEVTNANYMEYLHFLAQDSSDQVLSNAYPDTTIFGSRHFKKLLNHKQSYYLQKGDKKIPMSELLHDEIIHEPAAAHHWWNYFSFHDTKHSPVVGISYAQALAYCQWRSAFVTHYFETVLKNKPKYNKWEGLEVHFVFSLPTEKEWEMGATAGLDGDKYPYGTQEIYKKPHKKLFTTKGHSKEKVAEIKAYNNNGSVLVFNVADRVHPLWKKERHEPQMIFDNYPNSLGFYNLIGNVAEMVMESGISKGGSYAQPLEQCQIRKQLPYSHPEKWLGFRCVCQVQVSPKKGL